MATRANGLRNPFAAGIRGLIAITTGGVNPGLTLAAVTLEGAIKLELSRPGSGRIYGRHQASAPGDPPAPDTGTLRASIGHEQTGDTVRVGSSLAQAGTLEFGTVRAGRGRRTVIEPRPFMRPALARVRGQLTADVAGELRSRR